MAGDGRVRGRPVRLATRGSPLALHQTAIVTELLHAAHPGLEVEPVVVRTRGDEHTLAADLVEG